MIPNVRISAATTGEIKMDDFALVSVLGVPLMFVVIGTVEYIKKMGVQGKALLGASMAAGLIYGAGYQFMARGFPTDFAGWFSVIVYGIAIGILASGVYDANKSAGK